MTDEQLKMVQEKVDLDYSLKVKHDDHNEGFIFEDYEGNKIVSIRRTEHDYDQFEVKVHTIEYIEFDHLSCLVDFMLMAVNNND